MKTEIEKETPQQRTALSSVLRKKRIRIDRAKNQDRARHAGVARLQQRYVMYGMVYDDDSR